MFESAKRINFRNDVPEYWQRVSKSCTPFNVSIPIDENWNESKNRVLLIIEHTPSADIANYSLLSKPSLAVLNNCFKYATKLANPYGFKSLGDFAFAAINFNFFRNYHLAPSLREQSFPECNARIEAFVRKYDPTHIIVFGDTAARSLFAEHNENILIQKGWRHKIKYADKKRIVWNTVDFGEAVPYKTERDDGSYTDDDANLAAVYTLGYMSRNLRNFLIDELPHSIADIPVKVKLIDTMEKFYKLMKKLNKADKVAFDTETANLNKIANKLLTLQFSIDTKVGYVLPYLHKDTPFSASQLDEIRIELRKFFMKKKKMTTESYLIAFNAKFDITVVKQALGIPFIYWPVYDAMAGEHAHDETLRFMRNQSETPHGGMAQICTNYGNDFYFTAGFSKKDRGNMENTDLFDNDFLEYCAADSVLLMGLHYAQIERAKHIIHLENGKPVTYEKDYMRVVLKQMSNNIHIFANMEHRGIHMDAKYVAEMKMKTSPISQAITTQIKQFADNKAVKKTNKLLLADMGDNQKGGLFNYTPWIFDIGKPAHKAKLFFDVLRLKPLSYGKKVDDAGNHAGNIDKAFKAHYADIPEVALLNSLEKLKKLKSSYVDAFARQLNNDDGVIDKNLRPMYGFFNVLTGRSNSEKPSLQQVPQHSENAKYIKRMFAPERGKLLIKFDMSAHEVRCWSIISGDELLANLFYIGRKIRQKFVRKLKKKYANELKNKGDVHKLNVEFFFGTPVDQVTKPERNAIKGVVFGAIYGRSYRTLAAGFKDDDVKRLSNKLASLEKELNKLTADA